MTGKNDYIGMNALYNELVKKNGGYALPWLITLSDKEENLVLRFVNGVQDVDFNGNTYKAESFKYTPNAGAQGFDGGGNLEISIYDENSQPNQIIDLIETYRHIKINVVGVLAKTGEVQEIRQFNHTYCRVTVSQGKAKFAFEKDDRLSMTFPALLWNAANNRGNS